MFGSSRSELSPPPNRSVMMSKTVWTALIALSSVLVFSGCDSSLSQEGCSGDIIQHGTTEYCVASPVIVEEGFECPDDPAFSTRYPSEGYIICGPAGLPQDSVDDILELHRLQHTDVSDTSTPPDVSEDTPSDTPSDTASQSCEQPEQQIADTLRNPLTTIVDTRTVVTFDEAGNPIQVDTRAGTDGAFTSHTTRTYNDNGDILTEDYDQDGDESIDLKIARTYDDATGLVTLHEVDRGADGTVDRRITYTYEMGPGEVPTTRTADIDEDADGTTDSRTLTTYRTDGLEERSEHDEDLDGTADDVTTYTYDDDGKLISQLRDNAAPREDTLDTFTYDSEGRRATWTVDRGNNGTPDIIITYTYNAFGHLSVFDADDDINGIIDDKDRRTLYSYVCP